MKRSQFLALLASPLIAPLLNGEIPSDEAELSEITGIPTEVLESSFDDIERFIRDELAKRYANAINEMILRGEL